jgi:hypothetical protein
MSTNINLASGVSGRKIYFPNITKATWVKYYRIGPYRAVIGTHCESVGKIYYVHVLYLFGDEKGHGPLLAFASEYADLTGKNGERCLSLFQNGVHYNMGFSKDWADLELFIPKALQVAAERLGIEEKPEEVIVPNV